MTEALKDVVAEQSRLRDRLRELDRTLEALRGACGHDWGPAQAEHHLASYFPCVPSYPPAPSRWTRACTKCGQTQTTTRSLTRYEPDWSPDPKPVGVPWTLT